MIIYQLGDYDASGQCALDTTAKRTMAMVAERGGDCSRLTFVPLALSRDQVLTWNLPTRPPKKKEAGKQGSGHEAYGDEFAVELDAIPPVQFRELIIGALETHLSADDLAAHEDRVEGVRLYLRELAKVHAQDSPASLE
jgi:hypothetical protein